MPAKGGIALGAGRGKAPGFGKDEPVDVALQRPTSNIREAENVGEQASAAAGKDAPPVRFSKHGTFGANPAHPVESLWD